MLSDRSSDVTVGPRSLADIELIAAVVDADGTSRFLETEPLASPPSDNVETLQLWVSEGPFRIPDRLGAVPTADTRVYIPEIGGTKVSVVCFQPHSAGKSSITSAMDPKIHPEEEGSDMHWTDSVDYEFILSGKIDLHLPGGQVRTVGPGSVVVMAGAPHAWRNPYDEPCLYAAVLIGSEVVPA